MIKFSIVITTKNRLNDLIINLNSLDILIKRDDVELIICDDGSIDGTTDYLRKNYSNYILFFNKSSKGYLYNRNLLNNTAQGNFIISLDDDASFISQNPLEQIEDYFNKNAKCAIIAFRIFWGKQLPVKTLTSEKNKIVNSFVGCGHAWRRKNWNSIPNYPIFFDFYGEENFASLQVFKNQLEVHYLPTILIHHRVDLIERKKNNDYYFRYRKSLRNGWYLYFLFYPIIRIPKLFFYTLWIQLKTKVFKGDFKALFSIFKAILDVIIHMPKILRNSSRLTDSQYKKFRRLPEVNIYWKPEE
ncbi:glycosyl transferase [Polaribacter sp. SA4-10]|uniref:glycosyltransferase family 2 protein n=1 Tax=Polaribacter sp. SA4-10 TaxID=754397 RepID=UPI000B3CF165|nr:glycosyltransferase family 2 protein [Polaribacter sp. SA4-10]ARV05502.1 glycosyl transferase [Polaribacter sp. SA4-10]